MGWGTDPIVGAGSKPDAPPIKTSGGGSGWGKDPLTDATHEDGTLTPGMAAAREYYAGKDKYGQPRSVDAAGAALLQGATFNFGDEIFGGLSALDTGVSNLFTRATGGTPKFTAGEAYEAARDQVRLESTPNQFQQEYPHGNQTLGNLIGGVMTGGKPSGSAIKSAETVAGRLGRSALTGGAFGTVAGVGGGTDVVDRAEKGAGGAMWGTMLGSALGVGAELTGPAARGLNYVGKTAASLFKQMTGKTPDLASPKEVEKYGKMAIDIVKDMIKSSGKTIEQLTDDEAFKMGKPVIGAEAIGRSGINQAASIARRSGTTGDELESQLRLRNQETNDRLQENLAKSASLDVAHTQGHMEELVDSLTAKNHPRYEKAFAEAAPDIEHDKDFQNVASQPNFQEGLSIAQRAAANKQEAIALFKGDDGKWYGTPSWKHLDMIKKAMDSVITRKHTDNLGKFIADFQSNADVEGAGNFRSWMFGKNKSYEDAVHHAGDTITLRKSYDDAPRLMSKNISEHQFDKAINDMSPAQLEATKGGWVNDVYKKLQNGTLKPKDLAQKDFRAKATRLLGESQARTFISEAEQEMRLKANADRMMPGRQSITGELQHAQTEMDLKTDEMISDFANVLSRRGLKVAVASGAVSIVKGLLKDVRTPEERALRDEVGKLLLMKPDELQAKLLESEGKPGSPFRPAKVLSPKARDVAKMLLHLSTGPAAAATQE